jgi:hypothetical protein
VSIELTNSLSSLLKETATQLKGAAKRRSLHDVGNGRLPLDCAGGAATRTN